MVEFEADDAIATGAARWSEAPGIEQVVICSPDKDMTQCVRGARVVCLDRLRRKTLDEAGVVGKFGVGPASIPDWLALVGDDAAGIPGIPRWGAKSAATVLARYAHRGDPTMRAADDSTRRDAFASRFAGRSRAYRLLATLRQSPLAEEPGPVTGPDPPC
jgi:5'-3' exonuclease